MKTLGAFLFSLIFLCKPVLPVVCYFANYEYIVTKLCINKDNDSNECKGKCHLKMQLAEASSQTGNSLADIKMKQVESDICFFNIDCKYFQVTSCTAKCIPVDTYMDHYYSAFNISFFRPPASL